MKLKPIQMPRRPPMLEIKSISEVSTLLSSTSANGSRMKIFTNAIFSEAYLVRISAKLVKLNADKFDRIWFKSHSSLMQKASLFLTHSICWQMVGYQAIRDSFQASEQVLTSFIAIMQDSLVQMKVAGFGKVEAPTITLE